MADRTRNLDRNHDLQNTLANRENSQPDCDYRLSTLASERQTLTTPIPLDPHVLRSYHRQTVSTVAPHGLMSSENTIIDCDRDGLNLQILSSLCQDHSVTKSSTKPFQYPSFPDSLLRYSFCLARGVRLIEVLDL